MDHAGVDEKNYYKISWLSNTIFELLCEITVNSFSYKACKRANINRVCELSAPVISAAIEIDRKGAYNVHTVHTRQPEQLEFVISC